MHHKVSAKLLSALLVLVMIITSIAIMPATASAANTVELIYTNPGQEASTEMRISWHSNSTSCTLYYTKATDTSFSSAKTASVSYKSAPVAFSDKSSYYQFKATLSNLTPGTKYIYKIVSGSTTSAIHTFKTAEKDNSFNFMWMGDVHSISGSSSKITNVDKLLGYIEGRTSSNGGIDFILFSGDAVKYGGIYTCWQEWNSSKTIRNYMMASICGNKEYYKTSSTRVTNKWFLATQNNPTNGVSGLESTYWFIYNNVLFIGLDTLVSEGTEMSSSVKDFSLQKNWLKSVVNAQKGKYQYIVVYQHYPYFKKDGSICDYGDYDKWYKTYDELGVDWALSGDSHSYVRSKQLKNGSSSSSGTIYMVCPQIDSSTGTPSISTSISGGYVAAADTKGTSYGAIYFTVTSSKMTMYYVTTSNTIADQVSLNAKRDPISGGSSPTATPKPTSSATATPKPTATPAAGYILSQDFSVMPSVSSTEGNTTHGTWSTAYSSSMAAYHATLSQYHDTTNSDYYMKAAVTSGRYTVDLYVGFKGAISSSTLSFYVWVPSGSSVDRIEKITIGDTQILGQTGLTAGSWNKITTSAFGSNTAGAVRIEFHNKGGASGSYIYIDDVKITGAASATATPKPTATPTPKPTATPTPKPTATPTPKPTATPTPKPTSSGYILNQNFSTMPTVSTTIGNTSHGVWSVDYSTSMAAYHATLSRYYDSSNDDYYMKAAITSGRYTVDLYLGFQGASSSSTLSFYVWVPSSSSVDRIEKIQIGDTQILAQTTLTAGSWNKITTSAFGSNTSGAIRIEFHNKGGASGSYIYIDDVKITGNGSTATATPKPTATPTPKPTATPTPKPTATPTPKPTSTTDKILYQDFATMPNVSSTAGSTTHGTWSVAYSSSMAVNHATLSRYYNSEMSNSSMEVDVATGRYTVDLYLGFQGASSTSYLTFLVWIPEGSAISKVNKIAIGSTQILGETALTAGAWNRVTTSAFGSNTSGAITIEFYNNDGAAGSVFYIDDVTIYGKGGSTATATPKPTSTSTTTSGYINMGYLPYYHLDNYKSRDWSALTHCCLAFFNPKSSSSTTIVGKSEFSSSSTVQSVVDTLHGKGVKVLMSIGGASGKSYYNSSLMSSSSTRNQLVDNIISFCRQYGMDGVDVDIEASSSYTTIWDNYSAFISRLRDKCDQYGLILSTATAKWCAKSISDSTLNKFDIVGVMAYDNSSENHSSYDDMVSMCSYFAGRITDKKKILVGLPFYGRDKYSDCSGDDDIGYNEILAKDSDAFNKDYSSATGKAYNGGATLTRKCNYVKSVGYGGVMIWDLGQDVLNNQSKSLLQAVKVALYGTNGSAPR